MTDKDTIKNDDEEENILSEQDLLFNAWLDDELSDAEREDFEKRLVNDQEFKRDHQRFVSVMQVVRKIPFEFAPDDFVDNIQGHIRQRSRGSFFSNNFLTQPRMPYEVVAIVMMLVIAAVYILMEAPHDTDVKPVSTPEVQDITPPDLND